MPMQLPLVSISCITYNHEKYIRDCLEGFLMQKTNFQYEILIHDDASTDNTQTIIREYQAHFPDIIKPILQVDNKYSQGKNVFKINNDRALGKYIALCEGDDFWCDPQKLQVQCDFMEANPDFSFCGCRRYNLDQIKKMYYPLPYWTDEFPCVPPESTRRIFLGQHPFIQQAYFLEKTV